jgi:small subunit ribosomal protein S20
VANIKSAKARIKTNIRDHKKNVSTKTRIKTVFKKAEKAVKLKSEDMKALIQNAAKVIDTAVARGVLHKNTAARKKSRLMKKAAKK